MQAFPPHFSIGPVRLAPATVLAPMAGVTDTVFRRFIRNLGGCGLIMTEFTSSHGVSASLKTHKPNKTLQRYLRFDADEHPISAQLFGADPAVLGEAAASARTWASTSSTSTSAVPSTKWSSATAAPDCCAKSALPSPSRSP